MFKFTRWKAFLAKHRAPAEESGLYRILVTLLVMFALLLTLHQIEWPSYSVAIILLTPAASYLSYRRRHSANLEIKIFLSFAMVALLLWFFSRLAASLFDPRIPLAELLIWLQTLHAFDLPAKKDLRYTGLVALILMAMASVLTYSSSFILFLLLFCALFLVVVAVDFWSDNRTPGTHVGDLATSPSSGYRMDHSWLVRTVLLALPAAALAATVIFVFMPRYRGLTLRTMPFNWDIQFRLAHISNGEIVNSSLPKRSKHQSGKPEMIDGDSYFGFNSEVNLNARGSLTDRIVMKVRTSDWQYHRAVAFAEYTGGGWRSGLPEPEVKEVTEPPFYFETVQANQSRLTIYYAEVDLPNIVFTPSYPQTLYFPSSELYVVNSLVGRQKHVSNSPAFLVAPFALETGVVYSVLNRVPKAGPSEVKTLLGWRPEDPRWSVFEPYLQLPPSLPERVKDKALKLTAGRTTPWNKAAALTAYLQQNYSYNLEVGFYPDNVDTVDHFLFEAKEGYCEQFASTLCVMARTVGLPARYVTGYLPGSYNPLSGFYEVHANDAHAWVEIYLPNYGWMIFDPVPGGDANPSLKEAAAEGWLLESFFKYLNVPESVRQRLPAILRLFVLAAILSLLVALRKERSGPKATPSHSALSPYLTRAEGYTQPRRPGETVRTWSERVGGDAPRRLADIYERTLYRDRRPQPKDYQELEEVVRELKKAAKASAPQRD